MSLSPKPHLPGRIVVVASLLAACGGVSPRAPGSDPSGEGGTSATSGTGGTGGTAVIRDGAVAPVQHDAGQGGAQAGPDAAGPAPGDDGSVPVVPPPDAPVTPLQSLGLWKRQDIGAQVVPGKFLIDTPMNDTQSFMYKGGGLSVGGTADACNFMYVPVKGDGQVLANVQAMLMLNGGTMAGVMFRESLDADAAMIFAGPVSDGNSGRIIVRAKKGGPAMVMPGDAVTAPAPSLKTGQWLRLQRKGNNLLVYAGGRPDVVAAAAKPLATLALTLADAAAPGYFGIGSASGVVDDVTTVAISGLQVDNLTANPATATLSQVDVGTLGGVALYDPAAGSLTVNGWGEAWDTVMGTYREFMTLVGKPSPASFSVQTKVEKLDNTDPQTRAGIIYRAQLGTGSADLTTFNVSRGAGGFSISVTPGAGVIFAGRSSGYQETAWSNRMTVAGIKAPVWLRLDKVSAGGQDTLTAYYATPGGDGKPGTWTMVGAPVIVPVVLTSAIGLHVATFNADEGATALFSGITWDKATGTP